MLRNRSTKLSAAALMAAGLGTAHAQGKTLRIAMTAADIPRTLGQPDKSGHG